MGLANLGNLKDKRLLLGASGALQCLALPELLYTCKSLGVAKVGVILTPTARKMTSEYSLACVADDVIACIDPRRNHIKIARDYDRLVVAPATANFLAHAAIGATVNGLELVHLAMGCPSVIAPAMNSAMWNSACVQRNVATLIGDGHRVVKPHYGTVYEGASRMMKTDVSMASFDEILSQTAISFEDGATGNE